MDHELRDLQRKYEAEPSEETAIPYVLALVRSGADLEIDQEEWPICWKGYIDRRSSLRRLANKLREERGLEPLSNPKEWGGYRRHLIAPSTGTLITLVRTGESDLDPEGGPYHLICDEHGNLEGGHYQSDLGSQMSTPEDWCPDCREELT
jgi:hypothetical protein